MDKMTVRLDSFSGPMDLLYHLIEKNEIDIYDIPIAELTDQYLEFISREENKNMEGMSEFIVMAATLIEIKSRMLLPKTPNDEPEEDPREALVQRLLEYKKYKDAVDILAQRSENAAKYLYREPDIIIPKLREKDELSVEESLNGLTMDDLYRAFRDVMIRKEKKVDRVRSGFNSVRHDSFTVDEKIVSLKGILKISPKVKFYDMFSQDTTKEEILVTFLALLELIRRKKALVEQDDVFGEIVISAGENLDNDDDAEGGDIYENE